MSDDEFKRAMEKKYGLKGGHWDTKYNEDTGRPELVYTMPLNPKRGRKIARAPRGRNP